MTYSTTLSRDEIAQAIAVAQTRRLSCMFGKGSVDRFHNPEASPPPMWEREIQSACSEMCVARFLNCYWEGGTFGQGSPSATDAGGHQVRWTAHPTGHLIVERSAPLDHNYVLVTGKTPSFILRGYLHLAFLWDEGSEHKWWRGDSWWVPQGELKDCADLRDENTKPNPKNQ